jgi:hypothetical protein
MVLAATISQPHVKLKMSRISSGTRARSRKLAPAAERALAEAEERRRQAQQREPHLTAQEVGGRGGPDPTRYGDWEKKGIASDF